MSAPLASLVLTFKTVEVATVLVLSTEGVCRCVVTKASIPEPVNARTAKKQEIFIMVATLSTPADN